jgi:L-ascorbate metabolism protein UlaG (beta-lactamase superfamily)
MTNRPLSFLWLLLVTAVLVLPGGVATPEDETDSDSVILSRDRARGERLRNSPNYVGGRFVNELPTEPVRIKALGSVIGALIFPDEKRRPSGPLPIADCCPVSPLQPGLRVYWLGHSSVLIEIDSVRLLLDPVFDETVKHTAGFTRRFHRSPVARDALPPIDAVLISHDHFDHLELSTVEYLAPKGVTFFVPLGVGPLLETSRVPHDQIVELDWWEEVEFRSLRIVCTPARHYSGRELSEFNWTFWASWVIQSAERRIFYGGDTGYSDHFKQIGRKHGPFDLTLLPIGAYDDAWPDIHIGPEEAVVAHRALRGKLLLPVHWGTFDLAGHAWDDPIERLVQVAADERVAVVTPRPGEPVAPDQAGSYDVWWEKIE